MVQTTQELDIHSNQTDVLSKMASACLLGDQESQHQIMKDGESDGNNMPVDNEKNQDPKVPSNTTTEISITSIDKMPNSRDRY